MFVNRSPKWPINFVYDFMKKILILNILLVISNIIYGNMYSTSAYIHDRHSAYNTAAQMPMNSSYRTPRIGYSTVGYGRTGYYGGTYNPGNGENSNGRPGGGIRKITVYNGQGETAETPGKNNDNPDWLYKQDNDGTWWCSQDGGLTWKKWDSLWGWGLIGFAWRENRGDPSENATKWHNDPNDPYLQPIGEPIIPTTLLLLSYIGYKTLKRKRK